MAASLHHAKPLLSAAINSGFRESGVQSLKNLDDANACPMVAVRTAGLGLEAIIASVTEDDRVGSPHFQPLVSKDYCTMLLKASNERFEANQQRIDKFRASLREAMALENKKLQHIEEWESPEARRQRKRKEGLEAKEAAKANVPRGIESGDLISSKDDQECNELHPTN
jgi:tRNA wybutosine-synthesizing protein 3